ncbi:MAG: hypothetical protein OXB84_04275 [Halobacteriovoraceae bacterium]|nr:hypothetical protein [Halobacteriovoraceae bacterium]
MNTLVFIFLLLPISISWPESGVTGGGFGTGGVVVAPLASDYIHRQEYGEFNQYQILKNPFLNLYHANLADTYNLPFNNHLHNDLKVEDMKYAAAQALLYITEDHIDFPNFIYLPFEQIKDLKMDNGDIWGVEEFINNELKKNGIYNPSQNQRDFYDENNLAYSSDGIETGRYLDESFDIIKNYNTFLNRYMAGEIDVHTQDNWGEDENIYILYISSRKEVVDGEKLNTLLQYWNTDLNTPLQFKRYRHDPDNLHNAGNLRWDMVREDIAAAVNIATGEQQFHGMEDVNFRYNPRGYKYENKVYFNPYNEEITEILLKDDTYFDMMDVKEFMEDQQIPSMVDLSKNKIRSIVLQDGREIFIDELEELEEFMIGPNSLTLDEFPGN